MASEWAVDISKNEEPSMSERFTGCALIAAALLLLVFSNQVSLLAVLFPLSLVCAFALGRSAHCKPADAETEKR
jgi:hypothetical protein